MEQGAPSPAESPPPATPPPSPPPAAPPRGRPPQGRRDDRRRDRGPPPGDRPRGPPPIRVRTDSSVFIGDKPLMAYVFEAVAQMNSGAADVRIKARGKAIARAVDVAEVVRRHKLVEGKVQVVRVQIGTERLTNREGKDSNVSYIEIILAREAGPAPGPASSPNGPAPGTTGTGGPKAEASPPTAASGPG